MISFQPKNRAGKAAAAAAKAAAEAAAKKPKVVAMPSEAIRNVAAFTGDLKSIVNFSNAAKVVSEVVKDWKCVECEMDIFVPKPQTVAVAKGKAKKKNGNNANGKKDEQIILVFANGTSPFLCGVCQTGNCGELTCRGHKCIGCLKMECHACYRKHSVDCAACIRFGSYCEKCHGPNEEVKRCRICGFGLCQHHSDKCDKCGMTTCGVHDFCSETCSFCKKSFCQRCHDMIHCHVCQKKSCNAIGNGRTGIGCPKYEFDGANDLHICVDCKKHRRKRGRY